MRMLMSLAAYMNDELALHRLGRYAPYGETATPAVKRHGIGFSPLKPSRALMRVDMRLLRLRAPRWHFQDIVIGYARHFGLMIFSRWI